MDDSAVRDLESFGPVSLVRDVIAELGSDPDRVLLEASEFERVDLALAAFLIVNRGKAIHPADIHNMWWVLMTIQGAHDAEWMRPWDELEADQQMYYDAAVKRYREYARRVEVTRAARP